MHDPANWPVHPLSRFIDTLADAASQAILPHFRSGHAVENKLLQGFDPVTEADKAAERVMRALINKHHAGHGILGEEYGPENLDANDIWVLDPIDGTRAFITGLPTWGTLIGLTSGGKPTLGLMAQPYVGERFCGDTDTSWYTGPLGTCRLSCRPCPEIQDAVLMTTSPVLFPPSEKPAYDSIEKEVRLTRYGTDCYAYCMVAAGMADAVIESGLQAYDIAALVPVIEGAGGLVTTWSGGSPANGGQILATGDPKLHEKLLKRLASAAVDPD